MCCEGICSRVLILHWPLIDTHSKSWLTLDQHLNWYSADTQLTHSRPGVDSLICIDPHVVHWDVNQVSTEVTIECCSSVNQGSQSTLNHRCLYTWYHSVDKTSISTAQLPSYSSEILYPWEKKTITSPWSLTFSPLRSSYTALPSSPSSFLSPRLSSTTSPLTTVLDFSSALWNDSK